MKEKIAALEAEVICFWAAWNVPHDSNPGTPTSPLPLRAPSPQVAQWEIATKKLQGEWKFIVLQVRLWPAWKCCR